MATKLTQGQIILNYLEKKEGKEEFSIKEIYHAIHDNQDLEDILNKTTDGQYQWWSYNYLSSAFYNYSVKAKKPKITRRKLNDIFVYKLVK